MTQLKHFFLTPLFLALLFSTSAQSLRWSIKIDSSNIFSSPRFTDLNKDGIKDVVLGAGIEAVHSPNGIVAVDGKSGELLWSVPSPTQTYTSALFQDISGDGTDDVFIGGRAGSFLAIDGFSGNIIWEFYPASKGNPRLAGILNFYATQWLSDMDNDGYRDLLVSNGGDYLAKPEDKNRKGAVIMVISGKSGSVIQSVNFPEVRETYYAPHLVSHPDGDLVVFGSGGETIDGGLWKIQLSDLMKGKMKKATCILRDENKGFILNSVAADLNGDRIPDIMNAGMNAILSAIDGKTDTLLWQHKFPGYECYVTPSLAHLNDDGIPDFFTMIAKGDFPMYQSWRMIAVDGASGEVILDEERGFNQFSPAVFADLNDDRIDEIIFVENTLLDPSTFSIINQLSVIDIKNKRNYFVGPVRKGMSMASTPSLVDLDSDGKIEVVLTVTEFGGDEEGAASTIHCIDLDQEVPRISWPSYLGAKENGSFE